MAGKTVKKMTPTHREGTQKKVDPVKKEQDKPDTQNPEEPKKTK